MKVVTILIILLLGCKENCGECFTPPMPLIFEFIDTGTGENLFTNGTYNTEQLKIVNDSDGSNIDFTFFNKQNTDQLRINSFGWETEIINYNITIAGNLVFSLYVNAERVSANCCSHTSYHQIKITNSDYELNPQTGIYRILIDRQ